MKSRKVNLMYDAVFKTVFDKDIKSQIAMHSLLSAILKKKVVYTKIENNEMVPFYTLGKRPRMDIRVLFEVGRQTNLEIQVIHNQTELLPRILYYLSRLFSIRELKEEETYEKLQNTYPILIANFQVLPHLNKLIQQFEFCTNTRLSLGEAEKLLQMFIIQFPYVCETRNVQKMDPIERWNSFIRYYTDEQKKRL